jgi:hypothetical protein
LTKKLQNKQQVERPDKIDAGFIADPGVITNDDLRAMRRPLSIAVADDDKTFSRVMKGLVPDTLKDQGYPYQINLYSHVQNGFAVRRACITAAEIYAKKQAFIQAIRSAVPLYPHL